MKFCPKCEGILKKRKSRLECSRCAYTETVSNLHKEKTSIEIARETHPNAYKKWKDEDIKDIEKFWLEYSETKTKKEMIEQLSKRFGRDIGAIESQLNHMGYGCGLYEEMARQNSVKTDGKIKSEIDKKPDEQLKVNSETKVINDSEELIFQEVKLPGFEEDDSLKKQIISDIQGAVKNKKKFVILSAPTGIGKSWIASKIALMLGQATILTKQKSLQDQYIDDFGADSSRAFMNPVKGKSNFLCAQHFMQKDCSVGDCDDCNFKCVPNDFDIKNSGKIDEQIHVNNSKFIEDLSFLGSKKIELNSSKIKNTENMISAGDLLNPNQKKVLLDTTSSWSFAIEYENKIYFVLEDEKIPHNSALCTDSNNNPVMQNIEMCPYWKQREIGKKSSFPVYNYSSYISTRLNEKADDDSEKVDPKKVLICDEAQFLPDELLAESTIEIKYDFLERLMGTDIKARCKEYAQNNNIEKLVSLLEEVLEKIKDIRKEQTSHKSCLNFLSSRKHINLHRTSENCNIHKTLQVKTCKGCKKFKEEFVEPQMYLRCHSHDNIYSDEFSCDEDHSSMTREWIKQLKENVLNLDSNLKRIQTFYNTHDERLSEIFVSEDHWKYKKITLTPVQVDIAAQNLFAPFRLVIFMSSTIDKKLFCEDLGMDEESTKYLSYDSPIDQFRRRIYEYYTKEEVWKNDTFDSSMKLIIQRIEELMGKHPNQRGLILINSIDETNKIIADIHPELKKRLTYRNYQGEANAKTSSERKELEKFNEELLQEHKDKENSVLISPSMWEGVDLKNDLGRFCIIAKSPFAPGTGLLAKKKTKLREDKMDWKYTKDFFKLIQGFGRCTRGVKDHSNTFLIEPGCRDLLSRIKVYQNNHKDYKIKWFTDAIKPYNPN